MRAVILHEYGAIPEVGEVGDPEPGDGTVVLDVLAAGLNPVDLSMASGRFYGGSPPVPYVVGREGIGRAPGGERVYFDAPVAPSGAFAERAVVDPASTIPIPEGLDEGVAVSLGIAGLAAWLSLEFRARLRAGETVVVLGAGGVVGQVGVQAARLLGAARVVGAARSEEGLRRAQGLGADATVRIGEDVDALAEALRDATGGGADVVLDPLWGTPAEAAVQAVNMHARMVNLGQSAGPVASLSSRAVRGRMLAILGHTNFAVPREVKRAAYSRMAAHAAAGEIRVPVERLPLDRAPEAWERQRNSPGRKLVIVP